MSWDIFVQDIPSDARSVADSPDDFRPLPIRARAQVLEVIHSVAPFADFRDAACVHLDAAGVNIDISLDAEDPLRGFVFHIYGGDYSAGIVSDILKRLELRAFDPASDTGIFDPSRAEESFRRWQQYSDRVLSPESS